MLTSEQAELIRKGVRARENSRDPDRIRGVDRIEIEVVQGLSYRARAANEPAGLMKVDEPAERGGTGDGSSPLAHFLAGAGTCLLNQFIRIAISEVFDLKFTGAHVRGEFRRDVGGAIERIRSEVYAEGELPPDRAAWLTERAEAFCYVHNTLNKAVRMTTVLYVNGQEAVRKESGPGL